MKRKIFVFNVDNIIDIITNSSSELFILEGDTKEELTNLIKEVYPNYSNEYEDLVKLKEASLDQKRIYITYVVEKHDYSCDYSLSKEQRRKIDIDKAIERAKKYGMSPEEFYEDWYNCLSDKRWFFCSYSEKGINKIINTVDPEGKSFLLFSIDENPDWEHQERLMEIASRYHLG